MFYSHEILASNEYGVATIWLVATRYRNTTTGKVTRKAIQEVDVEKACNKIIEPGAPIALRLQGNLLYGISRVYRLQCDYTLTDIQKVRTHMSLFVQNLNQLATHPVEAKRSNLLILDDPAFVPEAPLPVLDLNPILNEPQFATKTSSQSQFSPPASFPSARTSSGRHHTPIYLGVNASQSSISLPNNSPFGVGDFLSSQRQENAFEDPEADPFQDDEYVGGIDLGIDVDADGNIIETQNLVPDNDTLELPPLPSVSANQQINEQDDIFIVEDEVPWNSNVAPQVRQGGSRRAAFSSAEPRSEQQPEDIPSAPSGRKKRARVIPLDMEPQISRSEIQRWREVPNRDSTASRKRRLPLRQARANAAQLTFGLGLFDVGQSLGVPSMPLHPLATEFSGDSLFTTTTGLEIQRQGTASIRSRLKRPAPHVVGDDGAQHGDRRVKLRSDHSEHDDYPMMLDNPETLGQDSSGGGGDVGGDYLRGTSPEVGRTVEDPMPDHPSSTLRMPWNHGSSAVPSSTRGDARDRGRLMTSSSPTRRGHQGDPIIRHSDDAPMSQDDQLGSGVRDFLPSDDDEDDGDQLLHLQHSSLTSTLDVESSNFLSFVAGHAADPEMGKHRHDDDREKGRRWVCFDDMFVPRTTQRLTATMAFYNLLCLATKDQLCAEQDKQQTGRRIWMGVVI